VEWVEEGRYSEGWVGWRVCCVLVMLGRVEDEDGFQRLSVQESAEERVPGREVCEEEAEAVMGMAGGDRDGGVEVLLVLLMLLVSVLVARVFI